MPVKKRQQNETERLPVDRYSQFRGVQGNVARYLLQSTRRAVNRGAIAVTRRRTLLIHAAFAGVLYLAVIVRAWFEEVGKVESFQVKFFHETVPGLSPVLRCECLHLNFSSFKASIRRRCIRFGASHRAPLVSMGFWCR